MTRILGLMVCFLVAAATGGFTQTHSHGQSHAPGEPHGRIGHAPMDPEQHAALHALLDGKWHGTLSKPEGESSQLTLNVSKTTSGADVFDVIGAPPLHLGKASQLGVEHHKIRWIQDISGELCQATADIVGATTQDAKVLKGRMSCAQGDLTFSLTKTAK